MKKIAVIGTVGVPANYGGFETLVENLLTYKQHSEITYRVYCSSPSYKEKRKMYKGASLIYLPLKANGWQALLYDSFSLLHACFTSDAVLALGCSCPIYPLVKFFCRKKLVVNVDGVETARAKWHGPARYMLGYCTRGAVKAADVCVSDNEAIRTYVRETYGRDSEVIEYGGDNASAVQDAQVLERDYGLKPGEYLFKVARIEPENNIGLVLEAAAREPQLPVVVVGNWSRSDYGRKLREQYASCAHIRMLDPIYDSARLNLLRSNCRLYVHGHSAGGTNPSLVEAMHLGLPILAFDVKYNRATTEGKALYFRDADELAALIRTTDDGSLARVAEAMSEIARRRYCWRIICEKYERLFL